MNLNTRGNKIAESYELVTIKNQSKGEEMHNIAEQTECFFSEWLSWKAIMPEILDSNGLQIRHLSNMLSY